MLILLNLDKIYDREIPEANSTSLNGKDNKYAKVTKLRHTQKKFTLM